MLFWQAGGARFVEGDHLEREADKAALHFEPPRVLPARVFRLLPPQDPFYVHATLVIRHGGARDGGKRREEVLGGGVVILWPDRGVAVGERDPLHLDVLLECLDGRQESGVVLLTHHVSRPALVRQPSSFLRLRAVQIPLLLQPPHVRALLLELRVLRGELRLQRHHHLGPAQLGSLGKRCTGAGRGVQQALLLLKLLLYLRDRRGKALARDGDSGGEPVG
mmetsp:Transcript_38783/g.91580  ORF Transcript_38783/g.91580 Transcript_38783/m.91580 type:complete len:221 (-) Transcript_38783:381-1043(-)